MEESLKLSQKQQLRQTLSPVQVQYVRLLEMGTAEIEDEVKRELDENPALEASSDDQSRQSDDQGETAEQMMLADYRSEDDVPSYRLEAKNGPSDRTFFDPDTRQEGETLMAYLAEQLRQSGMDGSELETAVFLAGSLDSNGYLTRALPLVREDLEVQTGVEVTMDEMRSALDTLRSLDPAGVGASDLRDCLLLQLRRLDPQQDVADATEIITHYFDLFAGMKMDRLMTAASLSESRLKAAIDLIRTLNPKPGATFEGSDSEAEIRAAHITPDFYVETDGDRLLLSMPDNLPHLAIEQSFDVDNIEISPRMPRRDADALAFLKSRRDSAADFIKAIGMRRETLWRVMTAIMRHQRDFFLTDDELKLRPMILKDIAAATGYDISVVSRATQGKYVATAGGVYPLKFFFNERPKSDSDASSLEIMAALRHLVDQENKRSPLSDEALTAALKAQGYDIARRTVAKYREKAGIPVARLRTLHGI
ncbi:RNA polymerase factor sigma-54 [Paramuribaculum intestinale]|uniref:RNA polymerase factor sigma-54 n=1 Tax=Paramuribaculum intestinale TaxID=2094151 RepID=UPI0025A9E5AB|nr:RNA polymerase factor sigma-54 [Paramuribaculum intestinale]